MPSPTLMSYTIEDTNGVKKSTFLATEFNGAVATMDDIIAEWGVAGNLVDNVSSGAIRGGHILVPLSPVAGMKTSPVVGTDVNDGLLLNFRNDTTRYLFGVLIPNIAQAIITGGRINLADAGVVALVNHLTAGFTNGNFSDLGNHGLTSLADAQQVDRKTRKQLKARSFTPAP